MTYKIAIALLIATLSLSCSPKRQSDSFCVTYRVDGFSSEPYKALISYQDSTGLVTFYTTAKYWSKKVCLPKGTSASLAAQPIADLNLYMKYMESQPICTNYKTTLSVRIYHDKKTVGAGGSKLVVVGLSPSDIE